MAASPETSACTFERATTVTPLGDGRFRADVDGGWSAPTAANGGYLAAILMRAIEAHANPDGERQIRSLTVHYLRPVTPGPLEVAVELVRAGRRVATVRVSAFQEGREMLSALGALAARGLPAAGTWEPAMPRVAPAPPRDAPWVEPHRYREEGAGAWLGPRDRMPSVFQRILAAPRMGDVPFSGKPVEPGTAPETGGWIMLPEPRPIDVAFVALCTDVWWPPGLETLGRPALVPTIDLTIHVRADIPPEGLPDAAVLGRYRSTTALSGLVEEDAALFLPDGRLLAHSRQLAVFTPAE